MLVGHLRLTWCFIPFDVTFVLLVFMNVRSSCGTREPQQWKRLVKDEQDMLKDTMKLLMFCCKMRRSWSPLFEQAAGISSWTIMHPKSAPMTQAAIRRMIKESVDATIAAERARQANVRNDASGSGPVRGRDTAPAVHEYTFAGFMKCNPAAFYGLEGAVELRS
ncbi:hypothetical protein Tco_0385080 [Tanacetum coccineum]